MHITYIAHTHYMYAHTPPSIQATLISFLLKADNLTLLPANHSPCTGACCMNDSSFLSSHQGPKYA